MCTEASLSPSESAANGTATLCAAAFYCCYHNDFFFFTVFSARGFIRKVSRLILTPRRRRSRKTRRRRAARRAVVTDGKGPATVVLFRSVAPFPKRTRADKTNVLTRNGRSPRVIGSTVFRSNTIFKADVYYRPMRFGRAVIRGSANVRFTPLSDVAPRGRSVGAPTSRTRREPLLLFLLYYNYFMLFFFSLLNYRSLNKRAWAYDDALSSDVLFSTRLQRQGAGDDDESNNVSRAPGRPVIIVRRPLCLLLVRWRVRRTR